MQSLYRLGGLLMGSALALAASAASADVVVVVSAKSSVTTLSQRQIADIFLGRTSVYPDGTPALPIDQSEGAATRDEFYAKYSNKSAAQIKAYWAKIIFTGRGQPPKEADSDGELKKLLTDNPQAISYIDKTRVDGSVRVLYSP